MTGLIGAIIEAWSEFRVHKARVLLSLVGVAVAVCALTGVAGLGTIATQAQIEQMERGSGRPATFLIMPPFNPKTGESAPTEKFLDAVDGIVERYQIDYSGTVTGGETSVQFVDGVSPVYLTAVDVDYGVMHRVQIAEGAWFTEADRERLAPAIVINQAFWARLGSPDLTSSPTVVLRGSQPTTAVVVGVLPPVMWDESMTFLILNEGYTALAPPAPEWGPQTPQVELWVPPDLAPVLEERIRADLAGAFGDGWDASGSIQRQDYLAWGNGDPLGPLRLILGGIAALILALGALGLVNISLVTVKQRIREIGIRRAFGATSGRVFLAVMLESVVATVVAGAIGVIGAILIVRSPLVLDAIAPGLTDVPPFPVDAAIIGFVAAVGVGALAGLLPALVAVRVKVIDAIRA
jgi:putative ABC transport system permease protein